MLEGPCLTIGVHIARVAVRRREKRHDLINHPLRLRVEVEKVEELDPVRSAN